MFYRPFILPIVTMHFFFFLVDSLLCTVNATDVVAISVGLTAPLLVLAQKTRLNHLGVSCTAP